MPMKDLVKSGTDHELHQFRVVREIDGCFGVSAKGWFRFPIQAMMAGRFFLSLPLFPMKLSSTMNTLPATPRYRGRQTRQ